MKKETQTKKKIFLLIMVILIAIILSRLVVFLGDPTLMIRGMELHHFYLGVILLSVINILLLFSKTNKAHVILSAIGLGLVFDEFIFVMGKVRGPIDYSRTIYPSIILLPLVLVIVLLIFLLIKLFQK